ncbi:hypothetical protein V8C42DRAFT_342722 [Trichoderma barbatum]
MALQTVIFPTDPVVKIHLTINSVLVFIAIFTVGLRLFARFATGAKLWWDDFLIVLSVPQGIGMLVIQGLSCISTVKLSVFFFYLRIFPNKQMRIATQVVISFIIVWAVANVLMFFLVSCGAYNIISDFIVLILPLCTIWTLNTKKQMKIALTAICLAGLLVSAVAVSRIITLTHLKLENLTGTMVWVDFLSTFEVNLGIICVSLPMLGPLIARYYKKRGACKLGKYDPSEQSRQSGSKLSSRKKRPDLDSIALQSIYNHGTETNHAATVFSTSPDGSETHLSPPQRESSALERTRKDFIIVESKWEIHHS